MTRTYFLSILRSIKHSFSRFVSIVMIIALGTAFFIGIQATAPNMRNTAEKYYKEYNLMDIRVQSSVGLTNDDIGAILAADSGIEAATGSKFTDALVLVNGEVEKDIDGTQISTRVYGINTSYLANYVNFGVDEAGFMNRPRLLRGEYPDAENECLVDASRLSTPESYQIGSTITLMGDGEDIGASLSVSEFTIVGIIETPFYVSFERGNTRIGSGKIGTFIIVPESVFVEDYYSEIYVKVYGSEQYDAYSDEYRRYIEPYVAKIKAIAATRLEARVAYLKAQIPQDIAAAEAQLAAAKSNVNTKTSELETTIAMLRENIALLSAQLAAAQNVYNVDLVDAQTTLDLNKEQYNDALKDYEKKYQDYTQSAEALAQKKIQYTAAESEYNTNKAAYDSAYSKTQAAKTTIETTESLIQAAEQLLAELQRTQTDNPEQIETFLSIIRTTYPDIYTYIVGNSATGLARDVIANIEPYVREQKAALIVQKQELTTTETTLAEKKTTLDAANAELSAKTVELTAADAKKTEAENQLTEYYQQISTTATELTSSDFQLALKKIETKMMLEELSGQRDTLTANLTTAESALEMAQAQIHSAVGTQTAVYEQRIENAKKTLLNLGSAYWNIFDRDDTPGYSSFGSTADNLKVLANIFPIFFFIVAALVCLTTMTRMVDEDRTTVGAIRALGYNNGAIAAKYIIYAVSACAIGCSIGIVVGMYLFPFAIFRAYSIMYTIPDLEYALPVGITIIGILISLACTLFATLVALRRELSEQPAALMRAKAPKPGKRILLEKIGFLWRQMGFTSKVTARNLFRNKQRFLMTVIGIAGCTALMLASLGMYNSVSAILSKQYGDNAISHYDFQIVFENEQPSGAANSIEYQTLISSTSVGSTMLTSMKSVTGFSARSMKEEDVYLFVPAEPERLAEFVTLHNRSSGKSYVPTLNGALITEKFARDTNTKAGETIYIQTSDAKTYEIFVAGIVENYTFHYIYISPDYYTEIFKTQPTYSYAIGNLSETMKATDAANLTTLKGQLATKLMQVDGIQAVSYTTDINDTFREITGALTTVIIIFFLSALILAFVVLYNLTNINILERNREIATLKVLGFIDSEVNRYILRENVLLTAFGTGFGLVLGIGLHYLLITYAEIDTVMFGRTIEWFSYLIAIVLTFLFAAVVNLLINRKLKNIDMVLSLKSVE